MFDLHHKLKCIYDDLYRRRPTDHSNTIQMNVSSSSSHDSGIQANLSCVEELNDIICDIQELIKNIDLLVSNYWPIIVFNDKKKNYSGRIV